jgi:hypothetical protein
MTDETTTPTPDVVTPMADPIPPTEPTETPTPEEIPASEPVAE